MSFDRTVRRRSYLGAIAAGSISVAGCVRDGERSDAAIDETVDSASFLGFSAVGGDSIEVTVRTISGDRTLLDLVDPDSGEKLIDGAGITDERTFTREARSTGPHEVYVVPDGRAAVTVRVE